MNTIIYAKFVVSDTHVWGKVCTLQKRHAMVKITGVPKTVAEFHSYFLKFPEINKWNLSDFAVFQLNFIF